MSIRQPLRNALLQNDLDAAGNYILDAGGIGDGRANTAIIDPVNGNDSRAYVNGGIPFKTLAATLAAISVDQHNHNDARTPYVVEMRPGDYAFDGVQEISNGGIILRGYGARLIAATATNEQTKLIVSGASVVLDGLELDGQVDVTMLPAGFDNSDAAAGAIQINGGSSLTIRNCSIHDWAAAAIYAADGYRGLKVRDCVISECQNGSLFVTSGQDVLGVDYVDNEVSSNRRNGLLVKGSANSATQKGIANVHIERNDFSNNVNAAMNLRDYVRDVFLVNNYVFGCGDGIILHHCLRGMIADNQIVNTVNPVLLDGCKIIKMGVNTIDGRNSSGVPVTSTAIMLQGFYAAAGDTGPFNISGNIVIGLGSLRRAIYCVAQNNVLITGNRMTGTVSIQDTDQVEVKGNTIEALTDLPLILVQAISDNCYGVIISGNRLSPPSGISYHSAIKTSNLSGFVVRSLHVVANSTPLGITYIDGIIQHAADPPVNQYVMANVPPSTDATTGWVNDPTEDPPLFIKTVFVSQALGNDTTALRERYDKPFLTINAAITAAIAGDTVRVADGTFNEKLLAKDGITVRFDPAANLASTSTGGGCIATTADNQVFTVYHEHTPMTFSGSGAKGISLAHLDCKIDLHGGISGTGGFGISVTNGGRVRIYDGDITITDFQAIIISANGGNVEVRRGNISATGTGFYAITASDGEVRIFDSLIIGQGANGVVSINAANTQHIYVNCTFRQLTATKGCIYFSTTGALRPVFQNCVLVSAAFASESMQAGSAQDVLLYGDVIADYGPNPPTNVTFVGPGSYAVDVPIVEIQN